MKNIKVCNDKDKRLVTHVVTGKPSLDEVITVLEEFYSQSPYFHLLWDFSGADVSDYKNGEIEKIVSTVKEKAEATKKGGKRAIVAPSDLQFGLARTYETFTEIYDHPVPHKVFRLKDEAIEWLFGDG